MKTILEHLESNLKPETLEKAIINAKLKHKEGSESLLSHKVESFKAAISGLFVWDQTIEGQQFWSEIEGNNGDAEKQKPRDVEEMIVELRTKHGQLEDEGASSDEL